MTKRLGAATVAAGLCVGVGGQLMQARGVPGCIPFVLTALGAITLATLAWLIKKGAHLRRRSVAWFLAIVMTLGALAYIRDTLRCVLR